MKYTILIMLFFCVQKIFSMNHELQDKNITKEKIKIMLNFNEDLMQTKKEDTNLKRRSSPPNLGSQSTLKLDIANEDKIQEEKRTSLKKNIKKNGSNNTSFSETKEKVFLKNPSYDAMKVQTNDFIVLDVPEGSSKAIQTSHTLDLVAHSQLNSKIEGVEYQLKQMCQKGFDCNDKLVIMSAEQKRMNQCNRLLFCGCIGCAAVYVILSITGIVLSIHFIPLK